MSAKHVGGLGRMFWCVCCAVVLLGVMGGGKTAKAVDFEQPTAFEVGGTWFAIPLGLPAPLGALMFSADGATLYVVGDAESVDGAVYALTVVRDPATQAITDLQGPATLVLAGAAGVSGLDAGLEVGPEGTLFASYYSANAVGQRPGGVSGPAETIYDLSTSGFASSISGLTFSPHRDDSVTSFGVLQGVMYSGGEIREIPLTPQGNGLFQPGTSTLFADTNLSMGAIQYAPPGDSLLAGDLIVADYGGIIWGIQIDPTTGAPIDAITGLPTLGTADPQMYYVAYTLDGPWGMVFDPITGDLFVSTYDSVAPDFTDSAIYRITGRGLSENDLDGDGHLNIIAGGLDCNDDDPAINPDALELCDVVDNDCSGTADDNLRDLNNNTVPDCYENLPDADPCLSDEMCASTFCADGVCCDTACGDDDLGDCQACSAAAGAAADGVCGAVSAGTVCRAAADQCDAEDQCDGTNTACANDKAPDDTVCDTGLCLAGVCEEIPSEDTASDTSGTSDTSGATSEDTSGATSEDTSTSGSTSGDTSGVTAEDTSTSGSTSGDTSGVTAEDASTSGSTSGDTATSGADAGADTTPLGGGDEEDCSCAVRNQQEQRSAKGLWAAVALLGFGLVRARKRRQG